MIKKNQKKLDFTQKITRLTGLILIFFIILSLALIFYIIKNRGKAPIFLPKNEQPKTQYQIEEEALQEASKDAVKKAKSQVLSTVDQINKNDHLWGGINAPVQIIVYSEFDCLFCYDFYETIKQIKKEFSDDEVVVAFRHFPMSSHPFSVLAAQASECAAEQGEFWSMYDELYKLNKAGEMSLEKFLEAAEDLNLNREQFKQCLIEEKYKSKVLEEEEAGRQAGVIGAPTVFVNNIPLPGAYPFDDFIRSNTGEEVEGMGTIIKKHLNKISDF